jgi:anti-sigma regulatory factor (Ser/Thr protein kinase)
MSKRCVIRDEYDVLHAQRCAKQFAKELGFPSRACQELAIVASELSSNVLKHGGGGALELSLATESGERALVLTASDSGPPFLDLNTALQDGCSDAGPIDPGDMLKRRGTASGLGAVVRLTHSLRVEQEPRGKRLIVVRFLDKPVSPWPGREQPQEASARARAPQDNSPRVRRR